ncbi:Diphthamide biosynthesis protein 4 [Golovinomyces cichoracearum]|uniref:Diphthamide biosynthesis protein 4 n=1 Tax=Golovinomyces cichoracearum TaxID=62708 RepID=A0A420IVP2_9PEZI|nr:Diphthamide biosynthesis protein 4 [Golovinomyces cichoracearum]
MSNLISGPSKYQSTCYEILGLSDHSQKSQLMSLKTLRTAYRRTLLRYHPDKISNSSAGKINPRYSIDQITQAYYTLLDPVTRAKYNHELQLRRRNPNIQSEKTESETVDLDDLVYKSSNATWHRSCRCGAEEGFFVQERDLENAAEDGEIIVECKGCSLWLKVLFFVSEED